MIWRYDIFFERSKRGGLTYVGSKRYSKANNKERGELFNSSEESSYITYLDATCLYPSVMIQPLPHSELKFVEHVNLEKYYLHQMILILDLW